MAEEDGLSWYDDQPPHTRNPNAMSVQDGNIVPFIPKKNLPKMKVSKQCKNCFIPFVAKGTKKYCIDCTPDDATRRLRHNKILKFGEDYFIKQLTNK